MAEFGENFRAGREKVICSLCNLHLDSQDMSLICPLLRRDLRNKGNLEDVYNQHVNIQTIKMIEEIQEYRKEKNARI